MKILITAVAVTAILATSAVAKSPRTNGARVQPDSNVAQLNYWSCRNHYARTDPDPRIRIQLLRDCKYYETSGSSQ